MCKRCEAIEQYKYHFLSLWIFHLLILRVLPRKLLCLVVFHLSYCVLLFLDIHLLSIYVCYILCSLTCLTSDIISLVELHLS